MSIVAELIELRTNDPAAVLRMANIEKFKDRSGYACKLTVRAHGFGCDEYGFSFDDFHLSAAISKLRRMDEGILDVAILTTMYEEHVFIKLRTDDWGHVFVSGNLLFGSIPPNCLQFGFRTDQTVLRPLIRDLQEIYSAKALP